MNAPFFERLEQVLRYQGPGAGFDLLIREALERKDFPLYFEVRLMQKRHELGLPLLDPGTISSLPAERQSAYQAFLASVARETGELFLAEGNIARASPYFDAIGDPAPVAAAIEKVQPGEGIDEIINVALHEGVNPRKGFELFLAQHGTCQAIELTLHYSEPANRKEFLKLVVRTLYRELVTGLKEAIANAEGRAPESDHVPTLIANRDWLFGGGGFYVENSHLSTVLQVSPELDDPETLRLAWEMADYGRHLAPMLQFPGPAPFEDLYVDHATYLGALLGMDQDAAVAHFRKKLEAGVRGAAEVLVGLLARLNRYDEAIQVSLERLGGDAGKGYPSAIRLCQMAGDYARLREVAREQGDLVAFAAGVIQD